MADLYPRPGDSTYGGGFKTKANLLADDAKDIVNRFPRQLEFSFLHL